MWPTISESLTHWMIGQFVIRRAAASKPALNKLADAIKLNVGLVFTDCEAKKIREILEKNKVVAGAKAGAVAPCNVFLEAGPTGKLASRIHISRIHAVTHKAKRRLPFSPCYMLYGG